MPLIQLYRCYVIYAMNYWVITFPFLMYLASVSTCLRLPQADSYANRLLSCHSFGYLGHISDLPTDRIPFGFDCRSRLRNSSIFDFPCAQRPAHAYDCRPPVPARQEGSKSHRSSDHRWRIVPCHQHDAHRVLCHLCHDFFTIYGTVGCRQFRCKCIFHSSHRDAGMC